MWAAVRWYISSRVRASSMPESGPPPVDHVLAGRPVLDLAGLLFRVAHQLPDLLQRRPRLDRDAGGFLHRLRLGAQLLEPGAGTGDELHVLLGQVAAFLLGRLYDTVDELLAVFDLAD